MDLPQNFPGLKKKKPRHRKKKSTNTNVVAPQNEIIEPPSKGMSPLEKVPVFNTKGPVSKNAFVAPKDVEKRKLFTQSMGLEMAQLRKTMALKDDKPEETDYHGPVETWGGKSSGPIKPNPKVVQRVGERIGNQQSRQDHPTVAISYRGGYGYDTGSFTKGTTKANPVPTPSTVKLLGRDPSDYEKTEAEKTGISERRKLVPKPLTEKDSNPVSLEGAHGLFIPGGQDATENPLEKSSREDYEQALIRRARTLGLPTLGVCGGSRSLSRGFGGVEQDLGPKETEIHNQRGTVPMPHGLTLSPHTILGGTKGGTVDKINSTHQKIVNFDKVNKLPGTGEPEIRVSATDEKGSPEGFETTHGAPIIGATSHPEAIHFGNRNARENASPQGKAWSDNVFHGFEQSMRAYAGKQQVNKQIRQGVKLRSFGKRMTPEEYGKLDFGFHRGSPQKTFSAAPSSLRHHNLFHEGHK